MGLRSILMSVHEQFIKKQSQADSTRRTARWKSVHYHVIFLVSFFFLSSLTSAYMQPYGYDRLLIPFKII